MALKVTKGFEVALDIADSGANRQFTLVEGDTGNRLSILLTDGGYPVDLSGCRVIAVFSKSNGSAFQDSGDEKGGVTLCGPLNNQVDIELFPGSVAPGMVECELQIYSDAELSTLVTTAKFNFSCRKALMGEDALPSLPQYPLLTELMQKVQQQEALCASAAAEARESAAACNAAIEGKLTTFEIIRYAAEAEEGV